MQRMLAQTRCVRPIVELLRSKADRKESYLGWNDRRGPRPAVVLLCPAQLVDFSEVPSMLLHVSVNVFNQTYY